MSGGTTTKHEYILSGSQIVRETVYNGSTEAYTVLYIYDDAGSPIAFRYRTPSYAAGVYDDYFLEKNLQGDIVAIYNTSGSKIVTYTYDAWGNFTAEGTQATTMGALNPFRYRGYYFDTETNLYYLQSRYYNSNWGRFINADGLVSTGAGILGHNMFAYCLNNPVGYSDPAGDSPYGILTLRDYYRMHKRVQRDCAREYQWITEVYVVKYDLDDKGEITKKRGYLDLYDPVTNTFYEVKSRGAYAATNGAKDQLERYSLSVVESRKVVLKPIDSPTPGSKLVSGTFEYGLYDVSYWSEVPGVIIYKPTLNDERAKAYTSVIVTVVFVVAAYVLGLGGVGGLAPVCLQ